MVNKVILIGNLGQDPEMRAAASGTAVANLRLATTDRRKDRETEWSGISNGAGKTVVHVVNQITTCVS